MENNLRNKFLASFNYYWLQTINGNFGQSPYKNLPTNIYLLNLLSHIYIYICMHVIGFSVIVFPQICLVIIFYSHDCHNSHDMYFFTMLNLLILGHSEIPWKNLHHFENAFVQMKNILIAVICSLFNRLS